MASTKRKITLQSSDGKLFEIPESTAMLSNTLKTIVLKDRLAKGLEISLQKVDGKTLSDVITYLRKHARVDASDKKKNKFDEKFVSDKDISALFNILLAADKLKIKGLQEIVTKKISDTMEDKSVEVVKKTWDVKLKTLLRKGKDKEESTASTFGILKMMMKSTSQYRF